MEKVSVFGRWLALLAFLLVGCTPTGMTETALPVVLTAGLPLATQTRAPIGTATPPVTVPPATPTPTDPYTPLAAMTRLPTFTATPVPTYVYLRGKVLVEQANCRYGPGWPYLYKYGVYKDSVLEIIGRNEAGSWVLVRGVGGTNACWVKASLLDIRGEVVNVAPTEFALPPSPYYGPLSGVTAARDGTTVTVSWNPLYLRAGDDSEQTMYVVEAWVCQQGALVFIPYGSNKPVLEIQDEWGCAEPSHARVTAAEKHGYTAYVEVPWPPAVEQLPVPDG